MRLQCVTFLAIIGYVAPAFGAPAPPSVRQVNPTDSIFTAVHGVVANLHTSVTKDLDSIGMSLESLLLQSPPAYRFSVYYYW